MRYNSLLPLLLLLVTSAFAQAPASGSAPTPTLPKEPAAIFAAAAPFYDFSSPTLKPWHMKASYQLYDENSKPTVQGTYEYWWAAPDTYRSTWSRPGVEQTDWHVSGEHFHVGTEEPLTFFERKIQSDLLTPLPDSKDLDPSKVRFDRQEEILGGVKLPCVMVIRKMPMYGQIQTVPMGLFPTFCFDPQNTTLRAYYAFGATSVIYNKVVRTQGMYLPRDVAIFDDKRRVLTATVDAVNSLSALAPELTPRKDVKALTGIEKVQIGSGMAQGLLLKQVRPVYPQDAKTARVEGTVILQALIGRDGRIHDLGVIDGPSPSLISSAMSAVSQWQYKPYMLNGSPVEVDTTINVVYHLGN